MAYSKKSRPEHNNIGVEVPAPPKRCEDTRCPWHGKLALRGRMHSGTVKSTGASRTATVEWHYVHYLPKYERYERRHSRIVAHNPECISAKEGDSVVVVECRPLSKTKSFVIVHKRGVKE